MTRDRRITVTEAARNFSDLVNRVFYRGESAMLIRNGVAVARLVPPGPETVSARDLAGRWETLPHLTPVEADLLAKALDDALRSLPPPEAPWE